MGNHGTVDEVSGVVMLALEILLHRWLPRRFQNRLVAIAYLAVSGMDD